MFVHLFLIYVFKCSQHAVKLLSLPLSQLAGKDCKCLGCSTDLKPKVTTRQLTEATVEGKKRGCKQTRRYGVPANPLRSLLAEV